MLSADHLLAVGCTRISHSIGMMHCTRMTPSAMRNSVREPVRPLHTDDKGSTKDW